MKVRNAFALVTLFIGLAACSDDKLPEGGTERYIVLLRSNQYKDSQIPLLTEKDIPKLLGHRSDPTVITNFPRNPISSFHQAECEVGIYLLWNIESIRRMEGSPHVLGKFASLNPVLKRIDSEHIELVSLDERQAYEAVANAYFRWYEDNKHRDFEAFKDINPLEGSPYIWH